MTDLQLKLMERADKTLSFGCVIKYDKNGRYSRYIGQSSGVPAMGFIWDNRDTVYPTEQYYLNKSEIIGHPYGIGRLIYFYEINYMKMPNLISKIGAINNHLSMNPILYTKPCIDRPEGSQRLALEFLESLPK